mmetsp:Transcript_15869/g.33540  ORF Transcript_15869/g.33540 Transcript_15869/m.33540 type:complete len:133 (-) Transcript_15869:227-625(-)
MTKGVGRRTRETFSKFLFMRQMSPSSEHHREEGSTSVIMDIDTPIRPQRRYARRPHPSCQCQSLPRTISFNSNSNHNLDINMSSCNSARSNTSQTSSGVSSSSQSSSSIQSSWRERKANRERQSGPNPFAFF